MTSHPQNKVNIRLCLKDRNTKSAEVKLLSQSDIAMRWTQVFQDPKSMPFPQCHIASQWIYLEDNVIFHFTDKDLRFGEVKKRKFSHILPRFQGHVVPSTPPLLTFSKPSPLWLFFPLLQKQAGLISSGDDTVSDSPLVMTIYGGTRWERLGNALIRKRLSFPSCFYFLYCLPPNSIHTWVCSERFFVC